MLTLLALFCAARAAPPNLVYLDAGSGQVLGPARGDPGTVEVFPRFFLVPPLALSPRVSGTPDADAVAVAPEVHANLAAGRFCFVGGVERQPTVEKSGFDVGSLAVLAAPEIALADGG